MIDDALLDVACPYCGAEVLELCTTNGRYMESTVHYPRRSAADVPLVAEEATPRDPERCKSGKHTRTAENTIPAKDGRNRCRPCANERQRRKNTVQPERTPGTHCIHGHEYTPENTYRAPKNGARRCITCKRHQRKNDYAKTGQ